MLTEPPIPNIGAGNPDWRKRIAAGLAGASPSLPSSFKLAKLPLIDRLLDRFGFVRRSRLPFRNITVSHHVAKEWGKPADLGEADA